MFNEIVAHRIGMLPIPTDEKTIEAFGDSIGDDSKQPEIMYSLHKQGPCTVYSGDLEPVNGDTSLTIPEKKSKPLAFPYSHRFPLNDYDLPLNLFFWEKGLSVNSWGPFVTEAKAY